MGWAACIHTTPQPLNVHPGAPGTGTGASGPNKQACSFHSLITLATHENPSTSSHSCNGCSVCGHALTQAPPAPLVLSPLHPDWSGHEPLGLKRRSWGLLSRLRARPGQARRPRPSGVRRGPRSLPRPRLWTRQPWVWRGEDPGPESRPPVPQTPAPQTVMSRVWGSCFSGPWCRPSLRPPQHVLFQPLCHEGPG